MGEVDVPEYALSTWLGIGWGEGGGGGRKWILFFYLFQAAMEAI